MKKILVAALFLVFTFWSFSCSSSTPAQQDPIKVSPLSLDFGKILLNDYVQDDVVVSNKSNTDFEISSITLNGINNSEYSIEMPTTLPTLNNPIVLSPNSSQKITIKFMPLTTVGKKQARLEIDCSISQTPISVTLTGIAILETKGDEVWGRTWGCSDNDVFESIASDSEGNIYAVGSFQNTIDLNPYDDNNPITTTDVDDHVSIGDTDCFLVKFDKDGNFVWGQTWGSTQVDRANGVVVDSNNNVFVAGDFELTVDFDPGVAIKSVTSLNDERDCFLLKFDQNGNFLWVKTWGGNQADWVYNCEKDTKDNILIVGKYRKTCDFDPGSTIHSSTSNGQGDCYVLKLSSSGSYLWSAVWGGEDPDHATCVAVGANNCVIVGGFFQKTVDFNFNTYTETRTSNGDLDCYVMKITETGTFQWVRTWGSDDSDRTNGVAGDSVGGVYAVGQFVNTCDFDPSSIINNYTSAGANDGFISKFDSAGNYVYTYFVSSNSGDIAQHVRCDDQNNVYITGGFKKTWDFNPADDGNPNTSGDEDLVSSYNGEDCFLVKYDSTGKYIYTKVFGGAGADRGYFIAKTEFNEIIFGGLFNNKIDLNPDDDSNNTTSSDVDEHLTIGDNDCFLVKLN